MGDPVLVLMAQPVSGLPSIVAATGYPSCEWSATAEAILIGLGLALPLIGAAVSVTSLRMKLPLEARPGPFDGRLLWVNASTRTAVMESRGVSSVTVYVSLAGTLKSTISELSSSRVRTAPLAVVHLTGLRVVNEPASSEARRFSHAGRPAANVLSWAARGFSAAAIAVVSRDCSDACSGEGTAILGPDALASLLSSQLLNTANNR